LLTCLSGAFNLRAPDSSRERSMMKRKIIGLTVILVVVIDLCVLLYPTASSYFNSLSQSRAVIRYLDDVSGLQEENVQALLEAARAYNRALLQRTNRFLFTDEEKLEYERQLDIGRGVMGVLVIDKINVKLAIYHGTDEGVLQVGLGHMQGTSLPVGGAGTHAFITGHRGLPSSTLLTDLDKMAEGDTFALYIMGETLTYRVDHIQTVEPHEIESLDIDRDMDCCTLVTCTPDGINPLRLLGRGRRAENAAGAGWEAIHADARWLDKIMTLLLFAVPVLPAMILYFVFKCRKIHKGGTVRR